VSERVDRWFFALLERAEDDARARRALIAVINGVFRLIAIERRLGGRRLLDHAREGAVRWGKRRARVLRDRLGLDVRDMGDMGRLQDWEDRVLGVTGHWTERSPTRAVKCETACPYARAAAAAPEICTYVVHALEEATFRELHPGYRLLPLERLLSKGHPSCEFVHVLDGGTST
jgi:hypothetical protein